MQKRVQKLVDELLCFEPSNNPVDDLIEFLQRDKDFLGVLLAITNLSQERLLRIITAKRFAEKDYGSEWSINGIYKKICNDRVFAESIARMFIEGKNNPNLAKYITDFYLKQLQLPEKWSDIIKDGNLIGNLIRKKLTGEYSDLKGKQFEKIVCDRIDKIAKKVRIKYLKGQVPLIGKESILLFHHWKIHLY
jgi:hypothetical protein